MRKSMACILGGIMLMLAGCGVATTEPQWSTAAEARAAARGSSGHYILRPNDQVRVGGKIRCTAELLGSAAPVTQEGLQSEMRRPPKHSTER